MSNDDVRKYLPDEQTLADVDDRELAQRRLDKVANDPELKRLNAELEAIESAPAPEAGPSERVEYVPPTTVPPMPRAPHLTQSRIKVADDVHPLRRPTQRSMQKAAEHDAQVAKAGRTVGGNTAKMPVVGAASPDGGVPPLAEPSQDAKPHSSPAPPTVALGVEPTARAPVQRRTLGWLGLLLLVVAATWVALRARRDEPTPVVTAIETSGRSSVASTLGASALAAPSSAPTQEPPRAAPSETATEPPTKPLPAKGTGASTATAEPKPAPTAPNVNPASVPTGPAVPPTAAATPNTAQPKAVPPELVQ